MFVVKTGMGRVRARKPAVLALAAASLATTTALTAGGPASASATQAAAKAVQDRVYRARRALDDVRTLREGEAATRHTAPATAALESVRAQMKSGLSRARAAIRTLEEKYQGGESDGSQREIDPETPAPTETANNDPANERRCDDRDAFYGR